MVLLRNVKFCKASIVQYILVSIGNLIHLLCSMFLNWARTGSFTRAKRQDSSIPAHAWSKLFLVTFYPLSIASETFF